MRKERDARVDILQMDDVLKTLNDKSICKLEIGTKNAEDAEKQKKRWNLTEPKSLLFIT
jgi:hypothetical protein